MTHIEEQTLTLAAICQVAAMVKKIARTGSIHDDDLKVMLNSIVLTSPNHLIEVYDNDVGHLKAGLTVLIEQLGNQTKDKDPELTRYVVSLLGLERRLATKRNQLSLLGERIEQSQRQLTHYDIMSETLIASLASIYSDLLSPLGTPIQVAGEPDILKQQSNQHKIRALLLAGIRATVLWRQVGGKRRNILFGRGKIVSCAEKLLKQI